MALIVDPLAKPVPMTAELWNTAYHCLARITLPEMEWPAYIRWRGKIFSMYHKTSVLNIPDEFVERRSQDYREIEIWDAP